VDPGAADGRADNLTFALAPGESNVVTLRGNLTLGQMLDLVTAKVRPVPVAASVVATPGVTYASFPPPSGVPARVASTTVLRFDRGTSQGDVTVSGSGGTPTSVVTIVRGGTSTAAVVTLTAGAATFTIDPPLAAGETLVAFYGGDATFLPSRSSTITALVTPVRIRTFYASGARAEIGVLDQGGAAITDAIVTVNGQRMTLRAGGSYADNLVPPVPAGGTLALRVEARGATVTGTGTVPVVPTITAPAFGDAFAIGATPIGTGSNAAPVAVSWSVPAPPTAAFNVWAAWAEASGTAGSTPIYAAPPTATTLDIPALVIGSGTPTVKVEAVNGGTLSGDFTVESYFQVASGEAAVGITSGRIQIRSTVDGGLLSSVAVFRGDGTDRTTRLATCDALVQVVGGAGTVVGTAPCQGATGQYLFDPPIAVAPNERVAITATFDPIFTPGGALSSSAFVSGVAPVPPNVAFPSAGSTLTAGSTVTATWTSRVDPQFFEYDFLWTAANGVLTARLGSALGTARSDIATVPAEASAAQGSTNVFFRLNGLNFADNVSDACSVQCFFRLRSDRDAVPVTVP
jgi:hypothetical protein